MRLIEQAKHTIEHAKESRAERIQATAKERLAMYEDFPHTEECPRKNGLFVDDTATFIANMDFFDSRIKTTLVLRCGDCGQEGTVFEY